MTGANLEESQKPCKHDQVLVPGNLQSNVWHGKIHVEETTYRARQPPWLDAGYLSRYELCCVTAPFYAFIDNKVSLCMNNSSPVCHMVHRSWLLTTYTIHISKLPAQKCMRHSLSHWYFSDAAIYLFDRLSAVWGSPSRSKWGLKSPDDQVKVASIIPVCAHTGRRYPWHDMSKECGVLSPTWSPAVSHRFHRSYTGPLNRWGKGARMSLPGARFVLSCSAYN